MASSSSLNESIFSIVCPERPGLGARGRGGMPLPSRGTRAQLQEEAAERRDTREAGRWRGRKFVERCNFAKNKSRGDGSCALGEPERREKGVRMTPFVAVPVPVGLGAFCCGCEAGGGEGVGRGGGRGGEDGHRGSLVRVTGAV